MDDTELLRQFESCKLPFAQWTHRTHVKVAFLFLQGYGFEGGLAKLRNGIRAYNAANDVPEGPTSGYNETTTHAFLQLIHATMQAYGEVMPTPDAESFCTTHRYLLNKHILRLFYSPERRMHPEAKSRFIERDLAPLPTIDAMRQAT